MPRRAALLLALLLAAPRAAAERIGTVTVRILDVFSPEEAAKGWVYRAANALHFKTREDVVRRFLLFREGDTYDPELLAQTERNLRALPFVKIAEVTASPPHDGVVDVLVVTQDPWTLEPGINYGSKGDVTTYGFEMQEKDLFGTGRGVTLKLDKGTERTSRTLTLNDPALFGPYVAGQLSLSSSSDGSEAKLEVQRPFFSFRELWSAGGLLDVLRLHARRYADGDLAEEVEDLHREARLSYGWALLATDERARRLTAEMDLVDDLFAHLPGRPADTLPGNRRFRDVGFTYDDISNDYVKMNYVNRDLRVEDFNLGAAFSATAAVSPAVFDAPNDTVYLSASGSRGVRLGNGFFLASLGISTRLDGGPTNTLASVDLDLVQKLPTKLLQTVVARLRIDRGWRLYHDVQLFADGLTGLRAYRLHAFAGNKRILLNVEHRIFSGREILQLVAPGAAIFVDSGTAAPEGRPLRISDFRTDAGVGLRFGIARAPSNNILRIDLAYAFQPDPSGRRGWLVSFSSAQAF